MKLLEIIEKVKKGEELTPEEKVVYDDYVKATSLQNSELEKIRKEKELFEEKAKLADKELQDRLKVLADKDELLKKEQSEKERLLQESLTLEGRLKNNEEYKKAQEAINKQKLESAKKAALEEARKVQEEKEKEANERYLTLEKQLEEFKKKDELTSFKISLSQEKLKRPYLIKKLDIIEKQLETKSLNEVKLIFEYELSTINHEKEMEKYKAKANKGTDIFKKNGDEGTKKVETTEKDDEKTILEKRRKRLSEIGIGNNY